MGRGRARQHRRRLLRHHAGPHPPHRRRGRQYKPPRKFRRAPKPRLSGLSRSSMGSRTDDANARRRIFVNIGERTNVTGSAEFPQADRGRRLSGARWRSRASRSRPAPRCIDVNMDEGLLDSEQAMTTFLNLIAAEPDIARVPIMIDCSKWEVIEAGLKCVQGKAIVNSISMKEGEAKFLEQARKARALWRRRGGDGLRRAGPGRHPRPQGRDLRARLPHPRPRRSASRRGHHLRPQHLRRRAPASRSTTTTRVDFIEATRGIKQSCRTRACSGGVSQRLVQLPRQRAGARGDALGVPLPRHRRRHGHGHRQRRRPAGL